MLSVMRMNKIFPIDRKNQTITAEPGALLIDIQAAAAAGGLFIRRIRAKNSFHRRQCYHKCRWHESGTIWTDQGFRPLYRAVMPDGSIMNFSSNVVKNTTGYDVKDLVIGSEGTLCILTQVTLKLLPAPTCTCTL